MTRLAVKKHRVVTPRQAVTEDRICDLPRDNVSTDEHWMSLSECVVTIANQRVGEKITGIAEIPRATFEAFIDWYNTGKWTKPKTKRKSA